MVDFSNTIQNHFTQSHKHSHFKMIVKNYQILVEMPIILNNYNDYLPMIKKNREDLMKINVKDTADLFWKKVKEAMNND